VRLAAPTRLLLALLLLAAPFAAAQDVDVLGKVGLPKEAPNDAVLDLGGMLDASAKQQIEELSIRYRTGSGHEVRLVTVPSLNGRPIEEVGLAIFRTWKMGREGVNDGAVLLVGRDEHALRIETGRGLEGTLPDVICSRIIRNVIVPRFQAGDFSGGLLEGMKAIHEAAGGDYGNIPDEESQENGVPPLVALFAMGAIFLLVFMLKRAGRHGRWRGKGVFPFGYPGFGGGGFRMGGFGGGFGGGGFGGGGFGGGFGGGGFGGGGGGGGASGGGASGHW
jgi:uncharacterized protein